MSRLDEIRERLEAANPGPWEVVDSRNGLGFGIVSNDSSAEWAGAIWRAEAEFIAHAREDIPFLLGEIERLSPLPADRSE